MAAAVVALAANATALAAADIGATTTLAGSVAAVTASKPGVGTVAGSQSKTIEVWMAGDQRAAARYAQAVSTPGSPSYRRFMSPTAYTQRFGPSAAQVEAVQSYLTGAGFAQVHASINDDYVSATGPVSTIDRAFSVQMRRYEVAGADGSQTRIESNDRDLSVPASIRSDILAVTGLNTARPQAANTATTSTSSRATTKAAACSRYWAQKTTTFTPAFHGLTKAAVPPCGYSAKQLRAA